MQARHLFSEDEDIAFLHVRDFDNLGTYSATAATRLKITEKEAWRLANYAAMRLLRITINEENGNAEDPRKT